MSSNTGYLTGGQNLTVIGHGFENGNIQATVDGVECTVTAHTDNTLSCEVQPKTTGASVLNSAYKGTHGITNVYTNTTGGGSEVTKQVITNLQLLSDNGDSHNSAFKAWFVAPATTRYRFYQTCDDNCNFAMDTTAGSISNPTILTQNNYYHSYRSYFEPGRTGSTLVSNWVSLTAG